MRTFVRRISAVVAASAAAIMAWAPNVSAQEWPTRPITLVVPFSAGGATDLAARQMTNEMSSKSRYRFVIENRTGANGNIGAALVARAAPDGYTLLFGLPGILATNRFMYATMPFAPDTAFDPVILVAKSPLVVVTAPTSSAQSVEQLIAIAKSNPEKLNFGSPGVGSQSHLMMELFQKLSATKLTHVPYRDNASMIADVMAGRIQLAPVFAPAVVSFVQDGRLRALFGTGLMRSVQLHDVPTLDESGYKGFESVAWYSVVAPAKTPTAIVQQLNADINSYLHSEAGKQQLGSLDMEPVGGSPEDLRKYIAKEVATWGPVIRDAKVGVQ
ncbi:tripartite tricarboxylate transporter substrate binding protein [Roseiarcaceae bacterium H3SJ34-1]|uniref:Bug family tripartite tricarboxylate transporter substrate binding protein n=1 Tax=Terripilifer ovatus TaxID=3032367 RepID=UPI003AB979DB|nr:tripartite tricarboxylate transporter substrate binding protein [Roseiarcaceae bacterium H3SJ34-1]